MTQQEREAYIARCDKILDLKKEIIKCCDELEGFRRNIKSATLDSLRNHLAIIYLRLDKLNKEYTDTFYSNIHHFIDSYTQQEIYHLDIERLDIERLLDDQVLGRFMNLFHGLRTIFNTPEKHFKYRIEKLSLEQEEKERVFAKYIDPLTTDFIAIPLLIRIEEESTSYEMVYDLKFFLEYLLNGTITSQAIEDDAEYTKIVCTVFAKLNAGLKKDPITQRKLTMFNFDLPSESFFQEFEWLLADPEKELQKLLSNLKGVLFIDNTNSKHNADSITSMNRPK